MNYLSSLFIDDEMSIDDKIEFVKAIRESHPFAAEVLGLIHQEKLIRSDVVERVPSASMQRQPGWTLSLENLFRPMGVAVSTLGVAVAVLLFVLLQPTSTSRENRFVIYQPDATRVEITGTFTEWKRVAVDKIGGSGYWEISLDLPEGEHRYTYILNGNDSITDPTVLTKEADDFGGHNTIIHTRYNT